MSDGQDRLLVKQSYERAFTILTTAESIEYVATASKTSLTHSPDCLVITNKRVMLLRKKVLGKYELDDCYWRDVRDLSIRESKNGVVLTVEAIQGWRITADALPSAQARKLIDLASAQSERVRDLLVQRNAFGATGASIPAALPGAPDIAAASAGAAKTATHPGGQTGAPVAPSPWTGLAPPSVVQEVPSRPAAAPTLSTTAAEERTGMSQANTPAVAPANFVPTPESVLQSILQQTQAAQDGALTRPMPLSAAAFQAPALAEAQPVTFSDTDTEPNMRPAPPMPTLEQIAVFSGPLAFSHPQSGELGSHVTASSGPLDLNEATSVLDEQSWTPSTESSALANALHDFGTTSRVAETNVTASNSAGQNGTAGPSQKRASAEPKISAASEEAGAANQNLPPAESAIENIVVQGNEIDLPFEVADLMGFMMSDSPGLDDERMPLPGTLSSGPLLEASNLDSLNTRRLAQRGATNTGSLPTEHLSFDSSLDDSDLDRPTNINLGQYSLPPAKPAKNGRSLGNDNSSKSQSARNSGSSSGTRSSQPKQPADDPIAKMKQLKMLLDAGFITESDYEAKKADILARYF